MKRCLVVYYSWTGNTAKVAKAIAEALSADIEQIEEVRPRTGGLAYLRCVIGSLFKSKPAIRPAKRRSSAYELVVIGCPVWAQDMAGPMRSWLTREAGKLMRVAVFCTEGGAGGARVLERMADLCGMPASAELIVTEAQLNSDEWRKQVRQFAEGIDQLLAMPVGNRDAG